MHETAPRASRRCGRTDTPSRLNRWALNAQAASCLSRFACSTDALDGNDADGEYDKDLAGDVDGACAMMLVMVSRVW